MFNQQYLWLKNWYVSSEQIIADCWPFHERYRFDLKARWKHKRHNGSCNGTCGEISTWYPSSINQSFVHSTYHTERSDSNRVAWNSTLLIYHYLVRPLLWKWEFLHLQITLKISTIESIPVRKFKGKVLMSLKKLMAGSPSQQFHHFVCEHPWLRKWIWINKDCYLGVFTY